MYKIECESFSKSFESYEDLYDWFIETVNFWIKVVSPLADLKSLGTQLSNSVNMDSIKPVNDRNTPEEKTAQITNSFKSNIHGRLYMPDSSEEIFIKSLFNKDSGESDKLILDFHERCDAVRAEIISLVFAYLKHYRVPNNALFMNQHMAFSIAEGFIRGDQKRLLAESGSFQSLRQQQSKEFEGLSKQLKNCKEDYDNQLKQIESLRESEKARYEKQLSDIEEEAEELRVKYEDRLRLESSVTYWSKQKEKYEKLASSKYNMFGILIFLLAIALAGILISAFYKLSGYTEKELELLLEMKSFVVPMVILIVALFIWFIRTVGKMYMSAQHLYEGAEQREVMIQTFLAMKNKDGALAEEDKAYILSYLFKPTNEGLVKEEGAPTPIIDIATKIAGGKKSPL